MLFTVRTKIRMLASSPVFQFTMFDYVSRVQLASHVLRGFSSILINHRTIKFSVFYSADHTLQ